MKCVILSRVNMPHFQIQGRLIHYLKLLKCAPTPMGLEFYPSRYMRLIYYPHFFCVLYYAEPKISQVY